MIEGIHTPDPQGTLRWCTDHKWGWMEGPFGFWLQERRYINVRTTSSVSSKPLWIYLLWNSKEDVSQNVHAALFHTMKVSGDLYGL